MFSVAPSGPRFTPNLGGESSKNTCFAVFSGAPSLNLGGEDFTPQTWRVWVVRGCYYAIKFSERVLESVSITWLATQGILFVAMGKLAPPTAELQISTPPPKSRKQDPYMREMGAICQIGVFTRKPCTFWGSKMGLFSAFSHYIFNDCDPNRGFHSDFALSPILTL